MSVGLIDLTSVSLRQWISSNSAIRWVVVSYISSLELLSESEITLILISEASENSYLSVSVDNNFSRS